AAGTRAAPGQRRRAAHDAGPAESRLPSGHEADDRPLLHRGHRPGQHEVPHRRADFGPQEARGLAVMDLPRIELPRIGIKARSKELGPDVTIPFPSALHWGLIVFLGFGEFPLNTVVFRLFGEAEFLTYLMASTLALIIPVIGLFIGIHMRHAIPRMAGNILIGLLAPITVGGALYAVSLLRNTYISSQFSAGAP